MEMDRNCEKMKELLPLFSGGDVEENERIAVEGHLAVCAECARESEAYIKARKELSFLREGPMPEVDLWSGVSAKLFPQKKGPSRLEWIVRYAAVVVMGLGIGFLVMTGSSSPSEETPVSSQSESISVVDSGEGMLGEADFAGTGGRARKRFGFDIPDAKFSLPEAISPSSGFVLPVVEKVHEKGGRSF
jgi:hypothetical protein